MFLGKSLSPKERVQGAPLLGDSRFAKEHRLSERSSLPLSGRANSERLV
jgi:hypothetical protein